MSVLIAAFILAAGLVEGEPQLVLDDLEFSEGPLWVPGKGWIFSDTPANVTLTLDKTVVRSDTGAGNGMALDSEGRIITCEGSGRRLSAMDKNGVVSTVVDAYEAKRLNSPNDLVIASDGSIYFTDPTGLRREEPSEIGFSGVYRLTKDGALTLIAKDLEYPNGIGLSLDQKTLYVSDTTGGLINAYDLGAAFPQGGRKICDVRVPDGMAVDPEGRIWTTSSSAVLVIDPVSGETLETIKVSWPTNCAFGGEDGKTLLITARKRVFSVQVK